MQCSQEEKETKLSKSKEKKKTEILRQGLLSCVNKGPQVVKNKQNYPK